MSHTNLSAAEIALLNSQLPPATPRWSPLPLAAHDAQQGRRSRRRRRGTRSFQHFYRPRRATATAVVVADPHNHQPERSLRPWAR